MRLFRKKKDGKNREGGTRRETEGPPPPKHERRSGEAVDRRNDSGPTTLGRRQRGVFPSCYAGRRLLFGWRYWVVNAHLGRGLSRLKIAVDAGTEPPD